jgi:DNA-binding NarL/FixJ family response regulator
MVITDEAARPAAVVHLLHAPATDDTLLALAELTAREREVCALLVAGTSTRAMATQLVISYATTRNHIQHVLDKLDVHSRGEAVARLRDAAWSGEPSPRSRGRDAPHP